MYHMFIKEDIWQYLSSTQRDLIHEGHYLIQSTEQHHFKDYSFLVFPFAKAYEGYLKQLFLDVNFMTHHDYISEHFRVGKFLSPHLIHRLKDRSIYAQIRKRSTEDLAHNMWLMWKEGRNEVFHYFPHNLKRLNYEQAIDVDERFLQVMLASYEQLKRPEKKNGSGVV